MQQGRLRASRGQTRGSANGSNSAASSLAGGLGTTSNLLVEVPGSGGGDTCTFGSGSPLPASRPAGTLMAR